MSSLPVRFSKQSSFRRYSSLRESWLLGDSNKDSCLWLTYYPDQIQGNSLDLTLLDYHTPQIWALKILSILKNHDQGWERVLQQSCCWLSRPHHPYISHSSTKGWLRVRQVGDMVLCTSLMSSAILTLIPRKNNLNEQFWLRRCPAQKLWSKEVVSTCWNDASS